jgi:hypothetical protein
VTVAAFEYMFCGASKSRKWYREIGINDDLLQRDSRGLPFLGNFRKSLVLIFIKFDSD